MEMIKQRSTIDYNINEKKSNNRKLQILSLQIEDKSDDGIVNIDISYIDAHNKSRTERKKSGNFNDRSEFDNLYRPEAIRSDAQVNYLDAEREPYNKKTYPEIDENTKEFVKRDLEQTRAAWARHSTRWV